MRLNNHVFRSQYFQTYLSYDGMMGFFLLKMLKKLM